MIRQTFSNLRHRGDAALIAYLTVGFPNVPQSMMHLRVLEAAGADFLEVGVPFSDPMADGAMIQYASQIALQQGATLPRILQEIASARLSAPVILMSYLNPLLPFGPERLFAELATNGVHGLIVPDLPIDEAEEWYRRTHQTGVKLIPMVAPTTTETRLRRLAQQPWEMIYCVTMTGTTGMKTRVDEALEDVVGEVREIVGCPVVVGFGVSTEVEVARLRDVADGIVVGSRMIEAVRNHEDLAALTRGLKKATRSAAKC